MEAYCWWPTESITSQYRIVFKSLQPVLVKENMGGGGVHRIKGGSRKGGFMCNPPPPRHFISYSLSARKELYFYLIRLVALAYVQRPLALVRSSIVQNDCSRPRELVNCIRSVVNNNNNNNNNRRNDSF